MQTGQDVRELGSSQGTGILISSTAADLKKRWKLILPAAFITYSLAYLDRANYGFGAAAGLADTLHITKSRSAMLSGLFFLGYFLFQIPSAHYAAHKSAVRLIFVAMILWGPLAALTGVVRDFWLLAVDRFLLGVAESVIIPAMLVLLMHWFTREERSRANTLLILGHPVTVLWMSVATGYLMQAFGWQRTFVLEGIPSILWAFLWVTLVRDRPADAPWMTDEGRRYLEANWAREQRSLPKVTGIGAAIRKPVVLLLGVQFFAWSIGLYGFVMWLPTVIRLGTASAISTTGLLTGVPYLFASMAMVLVAYLSDKSGQRTNFVWPSLLMAGIALFTSFLSGAHHFWMAYIALIVAGMGMYAPNATFLAIVPEMLPRNVAGEAMAFINACGALGGFVGAWSVGYLEAVTGGSQAGFLAMSIALIAAGTIMLSLRNCDSVYKPAG